eukprot:CAMPEP_0177591168 /NCGR_PEP_ID=MMETSP0419_2-20121207/7840_1 /TAXON_ID=582737 /ORGANISM="Tetraselmis sp., Strain GSL018" /LENGTH=192 /DNA_ID=CAMNT_0019081865 /DNA_START=447 /DNA_END=1026 /DNA_ORIENTATION=-
MTLRRCKPAAAAGFPSSGEPDAGGADGGPARVLEQLVQHVVQVVGDVRHPRPHVAADDDFGSAPVRLRADLSCPLGRIANGVEYGEVGGNDTNVVTAGAVEVDVLLGDHAAADPAPKHVVKEVVEVEPWANNGLCGTLAKPVRQGIQHWRVLIHQAAEQCRKLGVGANVLNGCLPSQGLKRVEIRVIDTTTM